MRGVMKDLIWLEDNIIYDYKHGVSLKGPWLERGESSALKLSSMTSLHGNRSLELLNMFGGGRVSH